MVKFPVYLRLLYPVIVSPISYLDFPCGTRPIFLKLGIIQLTMCTRLLLLVCRSVSKIGEGFWFFISCTYWGVICPFFLLCRPFVEWCILCCSGIDVLEYYHNFSCADQLQLLNTVFTYWCIVVAQCLCRGSCLNTDQSAHCPRGCLSTSEPSGGFFPDYRIKYNIWFGPVLFFKI